MKIVGIMPVRNEDWCIGLSLRALLYWVDSAVVLNHASTDKTADILRQIASETGRLTIIDEPDPLWMEMSHRQRLLETARTDGATHIVTLDADEVICGNTMGVIRDHIGALRPGHYLQTAMFNMVGSIERFGYDFSWWSLAITSVGFADTPELCWQSNNGYEFHHREPYNSKCGPKLPQSIGGVMHLQFVDQRRLEAKHARYKMDETVRWPGRKSAAEIDKMYSSAPNWARTAVTKDAPQEWWSPYHSLLQFLDIGGEPWQTAECRRMLAEHGAAKFAGLDLFGVV